MEYINISEKKIINNTIYYLYYLYNDINNILYYLYYITVYEKISLSNIYIKNIFFENNIYNNIEIDNNIFILIPKNNYNISIEIYNEIIKKSIFENICNNLILYKISTDVFNNLFNNPTCNNINLINKNKLERFNVYNYKLSDNNYIIKIFNISYDNIINYLDIFDISKYSIRNFYNFLTIQTYYFSNTDNSFIHMYIYSYIKKLSNTDLLLDKYDLSKYSIMFKDRTFSLLLSKISTPEIINLIKNMKVPNEYILNNNKNNCELSKLLINNTTYSLDKNKLNNMDDYINKHNITTIFINLSNKNRFLLFTKLMVSNKYCHMVINNIQILTLMADNIFKYNMLYKYLLSYSWIILYCDEKNKHHKVLTTDNFIFDIDTASSLPLFLSDKKNKMTNPYLPILIKKSLISKEFNGIENILYDTYYNIKKNNICTLSEFKIRLNLFCTYKNYNLFEDIDFKHYNMVIVGSIIPACLQRYHPLMKIFIPGNKFTFTNDIFNKYLDEYYANSDIDVMFIATDIKKFIDNVNYFYKTIYNTIEKHEKIDISNDINLNTIKLANIMVSHDFINKNIVILNELDKIKYINDNIFNKDIKELFKPHYYKLIEEHHNNLLKDLTKSEIMKLKKLYPDIYNYNDLILDYNINIVTHSIIDIKLGFTYKYIIETKYIKHKLELFKIDNTDFMTSVANFHLPCVRGYYNGDNVYLTPSCISSHLTFTNIDYTYFLCSKDPLFILHKYLSRGFGTILSNNEIKLMKEYILSNKTLIKLYSGKIKLEVSINDILFQPRKYIPEIYTDIVDLNNRYYHLNIPYFYISNKKYFNRLLCINLNELISIDINGKILPVKYFIMDTIMNIER